MSCRTSLFAGMNREQLQQALSQAQQAYLQLATGTKGVSFSYTQGDGSKSITYSQANMSQLTALILQLQEALGIICRARRPMRFIFQ